MNLPPLTALRHFNAAATHLSFKKAAEELYVSEGAVSRQIKVLEEYLGSRLFERLYRGVKLTETGQKLLNVSDTSFRHISGITKEIQGLENNLTISVTTSFAIRWLMKHLRDFEKNHPDIPINIQAITDPKRLIGRSFDISIIYQLGNPYDKKTSFPVEGELLMVEWLLPVCAPSLVNKSGPLAAKDLRQARLIFNEPTGRDWHSWLKRLPEAKADLTTALKFEHDDTAIQAAVAGHGIALANLAYISNELEMSSLVPAVDCDPLPIGAHYLISLVNQRASPPVDAFRRWILKRAAMDPSQLNK